MPASAGSSALSAARRITATDEPWQSSTCRKVSRRSDRSADMADGSRGSGVGWLPLLVGRILAVLDVWALTLLMILLTLWRTAIVKKT